MPDYDKAAAKLRTPLSGTPDFAQFVRFATNPKTTNTCADITSLGLDQKLEPGFPAGRASFLTEPAWDAGLGFILLWNVNPRRPVEIGSNLRARKLLFDNEGV